MKGSQLMSHSEESLHANQSFFEHTTVLDFTSLLWDILTPHSIEHYWLIMLLCFFLTLVLDLDLDIFTAKFTCDVAVDVQSHMHR